jgi:TetR/AcrR family transcriptional regulator
VAGRERNPDRSRERLLAAAVEEFSAKGFAGARVEAIAQRAGLNKQLISHYFGGKDGLYRAVTAERRARLAGELAELTAGVGESLTRLFDWARRDPLWLRTQLWEALEGDERPIGADDDRRALYQDRVRWLSAEQARGALPSGLDPDLLYLSLIGATMYPLLLPHVCRMVTGEDPTAAPFVDRYERHLMALTAALGGGPGEAAVPAVATKAARARRSGSGPG